MNHPENSFCSENAKFIPNIVTLLRCADIIMMDKRYNNVLTNLFCLRVLPVASKGSTESNWEMWTKQHLRPLETFLGYYCIPNVTTGLPSIYETINRRRNAFFGHVARLPDDVPAHKALNCQAKIYLGRPPSSQWHRCPGRPHNRWVDQIRNDNNLPPADLWRRTCLLYTSPSPRD